MRNPSRAGRRLPTRRRRPHALARSGLVLVLAATVSGVAAASSAQTAEADSLVRSESDSAQTLSVPPVVGWPEIQPDLALRTGFHHARRHGPDETSTTSELRARLQLGATWRASSRVAFRARLGGRYSTDQNGLRFYLRDHVPRVDGLRLGDTTVDELYVRWTPTRRVELQAGRMQTDFSLMGVARKSLDRLDSPSTEVTWTDGVHATLGLGRRWSQHLILQRNGSGGPSNVVRPPLDVTGLGSRLTVFTALRQVGESGLWAQRGLDLTYIPRSVPRASADASDPLARNRGYLAVVARAAVEPGFGVLGGRVLLGGEVGFAPVTPPREQIGTGGPSDGDGTGRAMQASVNLMDVGGRHSVGAVHARTGDGWLVSPDFRGNSQEWEARYDWRFATWGRLDARLRQRKEIRTRVGAIGRRRDTDLYVRTTFRLGAVRGASPSPAPPAPPPRSHRRRRGRGTGWASDVSRKSCGIRAPLCPTQHALRGDPARNLPERRFDDLGAYRTPATHR